MKYLLVLFVNVFGPQINNNLTTTIMLKNIKSKASGIYSACYANM